MTAALSGPAFSVHDIPFSAYGSWFDISPVIADSAVVVTASAGSCMCVVCPLGRALVTTTVLRLTGDGSGPGLRQSAALVDLSGFKVW
ncbi:hypothetical protein ACGFWD_44735 [Streptomyces sp. NPDC048448]|uniref:hypothetical protein n=1 Tax=Streptomyces sp. NPDC048448 TaxID=3365554 RepID=UPI003717BCD8